MSLPSLLESFESRQMMSVVPVLNTNDLGPGSLRQAVINASPGDTVDLTGVHGTITLMAGPLTIDKDITIIGPGQNDLTLHGGANDPVILNVNFDIVVKGVTLTGGKSSASSGGGVFNRGALELDDVTVRDNHAYLFGGGVFSRGRAVVLNNCTFLNNSVSGALEASGGGVYVDGGSLTMHNCTFTKNMAIGASNTSVASGPGTGGGIYLHDTLDSSITNCTFGDNTAQGGSGSLLSLSGQGAGGAIYTTTSHATLLDHCTIAYNTAKGGGNALLNTLAMSQGGGVYSAMNTTGVTLQDTIAALNTAANQPDVINGLINSLGGNLIGIYSGTLLAGTPIGDLLGTTLQPYAPGISSVLSQNGGATMTYALMNDSPAINAGSVSGGPALDQRGFGRRDRPDAGAFEFNPNHLPQIAAPSSAAAAGAAYTQGLAIVDADSDAVTVTSPNLPKFLKIQSVNGKPTLVGTPTEYDYGEYKIALNAYDGYQTTTTTFKLKVNIPGIALTDGLLRLNGSEFKDLLTVTPIKGNKIRVYRDGFKRDYAADDVKSIQIFGFGGDDEITSTVAVSTAVVAGDGNDRVHTSDAADNLDGGAGSDSLYGGGGNDKLFGGTGKDKLFGEAGNDVIHGNDGNDSIDGGVGTNKLYGDNGDDYFISNANARDYLFGGAGKNTGVFSKFDKITDVILSA